MRALAALAAGALVGLPSGAAAVLVHADTRWLVLGLAALATALWAAPGAARTGLALGWGYAVARGSLVRPEGDYLVSADAHGWTLLGGSLVLVVAALASAAVGAGRSRDPRLRGGPS